MSSLHFYKHKIHTRHTGVLVTTAIALMAILSPVKAVETIDMTAIDGYPPKALWVKEFINFYIPEIDKRLAEAGKYKIKWNQAWGGQIVKPKHVLEGIQKGLGDIGVVTTVFHGDKVPLQGIAYATPFVTTDPALVAETIDELVGKFPAFKEAWASYNQIYLTNLAVLDSYQMFFKVPVKDLSGFNGKKVASAGLNLRYLQGTGAVGQQGSLVSYYNKIKTGVADSTMLWAEAVNKFKIVEVAPYMLKADIGSVNSKAITVNTKKWNSLPAEVKKIIAEAAISYRDHMEKTVVKVAEKSYANFKKRGGTIYVMSDAERKKWASTMPNVAKDWAATLEKKGIPAKTILSAYMDKMRASKQPILRQWDKE